MGAGLMSKDTVLTKSSTSRAAATVVCSLFFILVLTSSARAAPNCGDGVVDAVMTSPYQWEQCDNGINNGVCPASCSTACMLNSCSSCGDGVVQTGEQCDNGASNGACPHSCRSDCRLNDCTVCGGEGQPLCFTPGDLYGHCLSGFNRCSNANYYAYDTCTAGMCPYCGNTVVESTKTPITTGEQCDDGGNNGPCATPGRHCSSSCMICSATCATPCGGACCTDGEVCTVTNSGTSVCEPVSTCAIPCAGACCAAGQTCTAYQCTGGFECTGTTCGSQCCGTGSLCCTTPAGYDTCIAQPDTTSCGGCGIVCKATETCCSHLSTTGAVSCADTQTDSENCGDTCTRCPAVSVSARDSNDMYCQAGTCVCPPGKRPKYTNNGGEMEFQGCTIVNELCNNNIDDEPDTYTDDADADCGITLVSDRNPVLPASSFTLTMNGRDGSFTTNKPYHICDDKGCTSDARKYVCKASGDYFDNEYTSMLACADVCGGAASCVTVITSVAGSCVGATLCTGQLSCAVTAPNALGEFTYSACTGQSAASTVVKVDIACDADGDGVNGTHLVAGVNHCVNAVDCNDANAAIHPGASESVASNTCSDGLDNNCDGEVDYDGFTSMTVAKNASGEYPRGAPLCPVAIVDVSAPAHVVFNHPFMFNCTASAYPVRSLMFGAINASCDSDSPLAKWVGGVYTLPCVVTDNSAASITCAVNMSRSYPGVPPGATWVFEGSAGPVCTSPPCTKIVVCDVDGDGYNRTDMPDECANGDDCNDANGFINPGALETIASNTCADHIDNNCNGGVDYDGFTNGLVPLNVSGLQPRGDPGCPVAVTALTGFPDACVGPEGTLFGTCTYSFASTRSVLAFVSNATNQTNCTLSNLSGLVAAFNCSVAGYPVGSVAVNCSVNLSSSWQSGVDQARDAPILAYKDECTMAGVTLPMCGSTGVCGPGSVSWFGSFLNATSGERVDADITYNVTMVHNASASFVKTVHQGNPGPPRIIPGDSVAEHDLAPGTYLIRANASGFERTTDRVFFGALENYHNVTLSPASCKGDCSYDSVCSYTDCEGVHDCSILDPYTGNNIPDYVAHRALVKKLCDGLNPGSVVQYNATNMFVCCSATPMTPKPNSDFRKGFSVVGCARNLEIISRRVMNNGEPQDIKVAVWKPCGETG